MRVYFHPDAVLGFKVSVHHLSLFVSKQLKMDEIWSIIYF